MGGTHRSIVVAAAALALAGCRSAFPMPSNDDFSTWSRTPLAPDPAMAVLALGEHTACRGNLDANKQLTILLQDRRTSSSAAFLLSAPGYFGSCLISASGSSGGSSTNVVPALTGVATVEEQGSGVSNGATNTTLGGLAAANVTAVKVGLRDGTEVTASVGNGYWLSWWPSDAPALQVSALDSTGLVVGVLDWRAGSWVAREPAQ